VFHSRSGVGIHDVARVEAWAPITHLSEVPTLSVLDNTIHTVPLKAYAEFKLPSALVESAAALSSKSTGLLFEHHFVLEVLLDHATTRLKPACV
jgi:hypothetical protein